MASLFLPKDTVPKANEEEQITEQEQRFISCLENELGARISSNILEFSDIKLNDIIDKTEGIMYFKGVQSGNNSYIIVKTNTTYDYDIINTLIYILVINMILFNYLI